MEQNNINKQTAPNSVVALVLGIASLVFGIVSLANKWRGKGLAIAGVTISSICLVVTIATQVFLGGLSACITEVISTTPEYYEEYKETGEIPEELEKFNNDEYDWYWKMTGNDDFVEFYDQWMTMYGTIAERQYAELPESCNTCIPKLLWQMDCMSKLAWYEKNDPNLKDEDSFIMKRFMKVE